MAGCTTRLITDDELQVSGMDRALKYVDYNV